jgi:hypothetical protein
MFPRAELATNPRHLSLMLARQAEALRRLVLFLAIIIDNCSVRCLLAKMFGAPKAHVLL